MTHEKPLLVSIEVCRHLLGGLARSTIYELIKKGDLKRVRIAGRSLISMQSIESLLERKGVQVGEAHNEQH